jgi:RNA polymerase sigma-70 factor (ECF subfamily)
MERQPPEAERLLAEIEDIYRHRYRSFLRFAVAMLRDRDLAHDAVQETFARAVRARSTLRDRAALDPWLWRMLANQCRDMLRARRSSSHTDEEVLVASDRPAANAELRDAISRLPERQRLMIFLRHYADLGYDQIAEIAGVERGTVAATLHSAHASLRRTMEGTAA